MSGKSGGRVGGLTGGGSGWRLSWSGLGMALVLGREANQVEPRLFRWASRPASPTEGRRACPSLWRALRLAIARLLLWLMKTLRLWRVPTMTRGAAFGPPFYV